MSVFNYFLRLNEDKTLLPLSAVKANQGENKTTRLKFIIPLIYADYNYTLETDNGTNKLSSGKLSGIVEEGYSLVLYHDLESGALSKSGKITLQLVARSKADNSICFKSQKTAQSVVEVTQAICANQNSYAAQDINAQMLDSLKNAQEMKQELTTALSQSNYASSFALNVAAQLTKDKLDGAFKGEKGDKGNKGDNGKDGVGSYLYIAWANSLTSNMLLVYPDEYIGICPSSSPTPPIGFDDYTWYKYKGDKGERGERGEKGEAGSNGERGQRGEAGLKGDKGDKGERGEKGDKGEEGNYPSLKFFEGFALQSGSDFVLEVLDGEVETGSFIEVFAANDSTQAVLDEYLLSRRVISYEGGFYLSFSSNPPSGLSLYYRIAKTA